MVVYARGYGVILSGEECCDGAAMIKLVSIFVGRACVRRAWVFLLCACGDCHLSAFEMTWSSKGFQSWECEVFGGKVIATVWFVG